MTSIIPSNIPVYCIYMPRKEKYIREVMNKYKFKVQFWPAVKGVDLPSLSELLKKKVINKYYLKRKLSNEGFSKIPLDEIENNPANSNYIRGIKGEIALQLSYLAIFNDFITNHKKADHVIIFEDDIVFKLEDIGKRMNRFKYILNNELSNMDWDIVNFGRCNDICSINNKITNNLVSETHPFCTHAVGYSKRVAVETLINSVPMHDTGDWLLAWYFYLMHFQLFQSLI